MTDFDDATQQYEAALEERSIDVRTYLLPGLPADEVRTALETASFPVVDGVVEWFGYCGGVVPASRTGRVYGGRGYYSLEAAISALSSDGLQDLSLPTSPFLPLTSDHPVLLIDLDCGAVLESDAEVGLRLVAPSIADWVLTRIEALPPLGPVPGARTLSPISLPFGTTRLTQFGRERVALIAALLNKLDIVRIWVQCAPPDSVPGNEGLELRQVEAFMTELERAGHTLANPEIRFEPQTAKGPHRISIILLEA